MVVAIAMDTTFVFYAGRIINYCTIASHSDSHDSTIIFMFYRVLRDYSRVSFLSINNQYLSSSK